MTKSFPKPDPVAIAAAQAANNLYTQPAVPVEQQSPTTALQPKAAPDTTPAALTFEEATAKIMRWDALKKQEAALKAERQALQNELNKSNLFDQTKETGTQTFLLGQGWKFTTTRPKVTKVQNANNEVTQAIMQLKALGEAERVRAEELFKFEAKLVADTYKLLSPVEKAIVDPLLSTSVGSVTLKLVPPKEKK